MAKSPSLLPAESTSKPDRSGGAPQGYLDLDKLRSADGIVAIISLRRATGVLTFAIFKEFERDHSGVIERTSFIPEALLDQYADMVQLAKERMKQLHVELDKQEKPAKQASRR